MEAETGSHISLLYPKLFLGKLKKSFMCWQNYSLVKASSTMEEHGPLYSSLGCYSDKVNKLTWLTPRCAYSQVPNKRRGGPNNQGGWKNFRNLINGGWSEF